VSVRRVPLDLAPILREDLFKRATTTVVTSARSPPTESSTFSRGGLVLDDPELEPRTGIFPSPFKYREQGSGDSTDIPRRTM